MLFPTGHKLKFTNKIKIYPSISYRHPIELVMNRLKNLPISTDRPTTRRWVVSVDVKYLHYRWNRKLPKGWNVSENKQILQVIIWSNFIFRGGWCWFAESYITSSNLFILSIQRVGNIARYRFPGTSTCTTNQSNPRKEFTLLPKVITFQCFKLAI